MKIITSVKGGEGSGFRGHAGIPGHQGGSQARSSVSIKLSSLEDLPNTPIAFDDWFKPGGYIHDLFDATYDGEHIAKLYEGMFDSYRSIPAKHFLRLKSITTTPPSGYVQLQETPDAWTTTRIPEGEVQSIGVYNHDGTIHMHPSCSTLADVFVHELGHHWTLGKTFGTGASIVDTYLPNIFAAIDTIRRMKDPVYEIGVYCKNMTKNAKEFCAEIYEAMHNDMFRSSDSRLMLQDYLDRFELLPMLKYMNIPGF